MLLIEFANIQGYDVALMVRMLAVDIALALIPVDGIGIAQGEYKRTPI
jgi:hypothetical protein